MYLQQENVHTISLFLLQLNKLTKRLKMYINKVHTFYEF